MRVLRYLAACLVSGILLGWAYGAFARGSFHYPPRRAAVAGWRQGLLDALDVVEWPGLFALALAVSLGLWAWSRRRAWAALPPRGRSAAAVLAGVLALAGALIAMSNADSFGLPLAGVAGGLMGALAAALLVALWREASAARGTVLARWVAQLPVAGGQLAVTSAASLSLGYRGESALVHGIALLIGIALFVSQLAAALVVAALARRAAADR